jgi:hypothetical protein
MSFAASRRSSGPWSAASVTGLDFNVENPQQELDRVHAEVCTKLVSFVADAGLAELAQAIKKEQV